MTVMLHQATGLPLLVPPGAHYILPSEVGY